VEVRVHVPTVLRELSGGRSVLSLDLGDDATMAELLDAVATTYPALERRVRDEQGALRAHVNLFVGDEDVRALAGTATTLRPGDSVSILAAISGG
jgi:molybdopterin synthase sulfur carrier subunit